MLACRRNTPTIACVCSFGPQICENVALLLTAYQVLLQWDLRALVVLIAATFGARMCSMLSTYVVLSMR